MKASLAAPLESGYLHLMDAIFAHWPGPPPTLKQLQRCHLISHRGEHRRPDILENTLAAFDEAAAAGIWGLELDVRWTRDLVPVVSHDADLHRLFQDRRRIGDMNFRSLRQEFAVIPTLSEVVARYGGILHLMIELKDMVWIKPDAQNRMLQQVLAPLRPVNDFHLIALVPSALAPVTGLPKQSMVLIATQWPSRWYRIVQISSWGGLCGHYSLMNSRLVRRLKQNGKAVGTGYADSLNCLFREIKRGVDWIFSNKAAEMQRRIRKISGPQI